MCHGAGGAHHRHLSQRPARIVGQNRLQHLIGRLPFSEHRQSPPAMAAIRYGLRDHHPGAGGGVQHQRRYRHIARGGSAPGDPVDGVHGADGKRRLTRRGVWLRLSEHASQLCMIMQRDCKAQAAGYVAYPPAPGHRPATVHRPRTALPHLPRSSHDTPRRTQRTAHHGLHRGGLPDLPRVTQGGTNRL